MKVETVGEARSTACGTLSDERFYHTECVVTAARELAVRFGEDTDRAMIAAYLHDIAKEMPSNDLLQMIECSDIIDVDEIRQCRPVWHAYAGGIYATQQLGVDSGIGDAISYHTTARAGMSNLEKIVFLADCISRDRDFNGIDELRKCAQQSLDEAMILAIQNQTVHLVRKRRHLDLNMIRAFNDLIEKTNTNPSI